MLVEIRQSDRQAPPEEIKPDYQDLQLRNQELEAEVLRLKKQAEELNSVPKPDLFALRDNILKSLTSGRGKIGTFSPQYKTAVKVLDKFIEELNKEKSASLENWESRAEEFLEEANWHE